MIGYYVHHQGSGHQHRATALAAALDDEVVGLSSLDKPSNWRGDWVRVPRDDTGESRQDVTAHGRFHWLPRGDRGLRSRMSRIASWIYLNDPNLLISDVSVEVTLLARLHGVPVLTMVLPGRRDDAAHRLALDVADAVVGAWPVGVPEMLPGSPDSLLARVECIGGLSRFPINEDHLAPRRGGRRRVAVMLGTGGNGPGAVTWERAQHLTPGWEWTIMAPGGTWHGDPQQVLIDSDVVIIQAGQNAVAEVAAARRPAVIIPAERPHDEQNTTARALGRGWPAVIIEHPESTDWSEILEHAHRLDPKDWRNWCDGRAATRFADIVRRLTAVESDGR